MRKLCPHRVADGDTEASEVNGAGAAGLAVGRRLQAGRGTCPSSLPLPGPEVLGLTPEGTAQTPDSSSPGCLLHRWRH